MPFRPFQNDIGLRVFRSICNVCWQEWLTYQKQLINHHGLDLRDPNAKQFLYANMERFLFKADETDKTGGTVKTDPA